MQRRTKAFFDPFNLFFILFALVFIGVLIWGIFFNKTTVEITNQGFDSASMQTGSLSLSIGALSINFGTGVIFKNTSNFTIILCLGKNQKCDPNTQGPQALHDRGLTIMPHQEKEITFGTGDYSVTLHTLHGSAMKQNNVIISVPDTPDLP